MLSYDSWTTITGCYRAFTQAFFVFKNMKLQGIELLKVCPFTYEARKG